MTKTLIGAPDPPDDITETEAVFLDEMATKTDVELIAAYIDQASRRPWIHTTHVVRILKLATLGLGGPPSE